MGPSRSQAIGQAAGFLLLPFVALAVWYFRSRWAPQRSVAAEHAIRLQLRPEPCMAMAAAAAEVCVMC